MPNEIGTLNLAFNFLTSELTDKREYVYHVIQKEKTTGNIVGGETYVIKKPVRTGFNANAGGDKEVNLNESVTITAEQINEPAVYNWYDTEGNLIHQGLDLTVTADMVKTYQLEVIATGDGFKDYDDVTVKFKPSTLETLVPNPASNSIEVSYKLNGAGSAYLMVLGYYGNSNSYNYILDTASTQTTLDISGYLAGFYTVALVVDGNIADAKTLIKQ